MENVLVTGGAGFIGSHTIVELLNGGYGVVVVDNLCNSSQESLKRVREITGKELVFYRGDVRDEVLLDRIFAENDVSSVIHFAGRKAVGESVQKPLLYYENNLGCTLALLSSMKKAGVKKLVFSSSATVYGVPERLPLTEDCRLSATNPYGATKLMTEQILTDVARADSQFNAIILRYFNPVGAHESGRIGEDPKGIPNNLMPFVAQVACGKREAVNVFGDDYPTSDGTGVRDYIHVVDLARGHIAALRGCDRPGVHIYNLGTGKGYSVLEMIRAFEKACGKTIPYRVTQRRAGDVAACYACPDKAAKELGWRAQYSLEEMCASQWKWQSDNPDGYGG